MIVGHVDGGRDAYLVCKFCGKEVRLGSEEIKKHITLYHKRIATFFAVGGNDIEGTCDCHPAAENPFNIGSWDER